MILCGFSNLDVYIARLHAAVLTAPPLPSPACAASALRPPVRRSYLRWSVHRPQPRRHCPCRHSSHWPRALPIRGRLALANYVHYLSVDLFWEAA